MTTHDFLSAEKEDLYRNQVPRLVGASGGIDATQAPSQVHTSTNTVDPADKSAKFYQLAIDRSASVQRIKASTTTSEAN